MEENLDLTDELVCPANWDDTISEGHNMAPMRSALDLENVEYDDMTEDERRYFISALKMKSSEMQKLTEDLFKQIKEQKQINEHNIKLAEDTLTFIKSTVTNALGSVSLAIKNMERGVR